MQLLAAIDWTSVLVAAIAAAPGTLGVVLVYGNRRRLHMPSGGTIGEKMEKTHDLAAVTAADVVRRNCGSHSP